MHKSCAFNWINTTTVQFIQIKLFVIIFSDQIVDNSDENDSGSNNNIDDENNCDTHLLISPVGNYAPVRLKSLDHEHAHKEITRIFLDTDVNIQNITSTLPDAGDEAAGRLSVLSADTSAGRRHDGSLTLLGSKITLRMVVIVGVAGPLLLLLCYLLLILVRHFIV